MAKVKTALRKIVIRMTDNHVMTSAVFSRHNRAKKLNQKSNQVPIYKHSKFIFINVQSLKGKNPVLVNRAGENHKRHLSRVVRKPAFYICENKDADQLRGNREADQHLCFRYMDSTIPQLPKSQISNL